MFSFGYVYQFLQLCTISKTAVLTMQLRIKHFFSDINTWQIFIYEISAKQYDKDSSVVVFFVQGLKSLRFKSLPHHAVVEVSSSLTSSFCC